MKKVILLVFFGISFNARSLDRAQRVIREAQKMMNPHLPIQELNASGPKEGRKGMTQEHEVERQAVDDLILNNNIAGLCQLASEWNRFGYSGKSLVRTALLDGRSKAEGALAVGNINFSLDVLTDGEQLCEDMSNMLYVPKEDSEFTIRAHRRIDTEIKKRQLRHAVPVIASLKAKGIKLSLGRERSALFLELLQERIAKDQDVLSLLVKQQEEHAQDDGKEDEVKPRKRGKKKKQRAQLSPKFEASPINEHELEELDAAPFSVDVSAQDEPEDDEV